MKVSDRTLDCCWIATSAALVLVLLDPFQNLPFLDDWTYAWSVARLVERGELRVLDWSTSANLAQVLWGALFCLPFGFSFAALRVSTAVLAIGGLCAFYLLLRELDVGRRGALLGTATLALNPIFFVLSWTFMTDVPFIVVMVASAAAAVRGFRLESRAWMIAAIVVGCLAPAVRNVGIVVPAALVAALAFHPRWGAKRQPILFAFAVLAPCAVVGTLLAWTSSHTEVVADLAGVRDAPTTRLQNLRYALPLRPSSLLTTATALTSVLGLALLPLAAAVGSRKLARTAGILTAIFFGGFAFAWAIGGSVYEPLGVGSFWALDDIGLTRATLRGYDPAGPPSWWRALSLVVVTTSFAIFLAGVSLSRARRAGEELLWWLAAGHVAMVAVLWLSHDRYLLALVPIAIALLVVRVPTVRFATPALLLGMFALVSLAGSRDQLAYNGGIWRGVELLRRAGARDAEIDGGYVVNGWLQYAHPEHAPRDARGRPVVPAVTDVINLRYRISSRPLDGWRVLETIAVDRTLGAPTKLYVLENRFPQLVAR